MSNESPETKDEVTQPDNKPDEAAFIAPPPNPRQCESIAKTVSGTGSDADKALAEGWASAYMDAIGETVGGKETEPDERPEINPQDRGDGGS
jgi:hypothetical protein